MLVQTMPFDVFRQAWYCFMLINPLMVYISLARQPLLRKKRERVWWKGSHCRVPVECNTWHFYVR
jgi:ABC-type polysaccharide/polyol phosphate export permease